MLACSVGESPVFKWSAKSRSDFYHLKTRSLCQVLNGSITHITILAFKNRITVRFFNGSINTHDKCGGHHRSVGPDAGRNSGGRWIKKHTWPSCYSKTRERSHNFQMNPEFGYLVKWGSKIGTYLDFEWSIFVWFLNGQSLSGFWMVRISNGSLA